MNINEIMTEDEMRELVRMSNELHRLSTLSLSGITLTRGQQDSLNWHLEQMEGREYLADLCRMEIARLEWNAKHPGREHEEMRAEFADALKSMRNAA